MSTKRLFGNHSTAIYIIAIVVIILAFLLLGGGQWLRGMMHGNGSIGISHLNWAQILISLVIGFLLGLLAGRRKW
jgi:H+/Cl- antiporter ClcA